MTTLDVLSTCTACGNCVITCGALAITKAPQRPIIDHDRCTRCDECIEVCPVDALVERPR